MRYESTANCKMIKLSILFLLLLCSLWFGGFKQITNGSALSQGQDSRNGLSESGSTSNSESSQSQSQSVEYNEICTESDCATANGATDNQASDASLSTLGGPCVTQSDCVNTTICSPLWSTVKGVFEGVCVCDKNFYANSDGTGCLPKAKHGEPCDPAGRGRTCENTNSLLTCDSATKICRCSDESAQVYEEGRGVCSIRVGEYCYQYRSQFHICVAHAVCKYHLGHKLQDKVRCKCRGGYNPTEDGGACLGGYGHACSATATATGRKGGGDGCDTEQGLVCTNGQCLCSHLLYQIFDESLQRCSKIIGAPCQSSSDCIHHATCSSSGVCECKPEFSATGDGFGCKRKYGAFCSRNDSGDADGGGGQCNPDSGLVCRGSKCECFDPSLSYNPVKGVCFNTEGQICGRLPASVNRAHWIWKAAGSFLNETKPVVQIGCEDGFLCTRIQGQRSCRCLAAEAMELDRTYRIQLCL